jgi:hypothetical protein
MPCAGRANLSGREVLIDQGSGRGVNPLRPLCQPPVVPMVSLLRKYPHIRLSSAVRRQHERERKLLSHIVGREGVPADVVDVPMDVSGDPDAPAKPHYPATLSTSASRGVSLANLVLSTKTATARTASAVSRPTMMLLVNPRTM